MDIKEVPFTPQKLTCLTIKQTIVAITSIITIIFWFILPYVKFLGNEAIIGFIPFVVFFGFNIVPRNALTELPWSMILLVMGGNALGTAIKESNLLTLISDIFGASFSKLNLYLQNFLLSLVVGIVSIFVSHTIAAIVLIPIVASIM